LSFWIAAGGVLGAVQAGDSVSIDGVSYLRQRVLIAPPPDRVVLVLNQIDLPQEGCVVDPANAVELPTKALLFDGEVRAVLDAHDLTIRLASSIAEVLGK
jgi:hypothetical protein